MEVILRIHRQLNICQKDAGMYKLEHIHGCVVLMSGLDITACVALENATDCPNRVSVTFSLLVSRVGREITVRFKCLMHTLIETKSIGFVRLCPTVSGRKVHIGRWDSMYTLRQRWCHDRHHASAVARITRQNPVTLSGSLRHVFYEPTQRSSSAGKKQFESPPHSEKILRVPAILKRTVTSCDVPRVLFSFHFRVLTLSWVCMPVLRDPTFTSRSAKFLQSITRLPFQDDMP